MATRTGAPTDSGPTSTTCEHCHAELGPSDIADRGGETRRCKRCGGRALRNREAVGRVSDAGGAG